MEDGLLIAEMAILVAPLLGAVFLTALCTGLATAVLSSPRVSVPVTLWRAQSPCALCRETELASWGRNPREAGGLAEPFGLILAEPFGLILGRIDGSVRDALSWRGPSRGKTLARLARLGEPGP